MLDSEGTERGMCYALSGKIVCQSSILRIARDLTDIDSHMCRRFLHARCRWAFKLPLFARLLVKGYGLIGAERSTVNAEVVKNAGEVVLRAKTDHERFPVRDFVIQVVEGR